MLLPTPTLLSFSLKSAAASAIKCIFKFPSSYISNLDIPFSKSCPSLKDDKDLLLRSVI